MNYRRSRSKGGCYFLTINLSNRKQSLLTQHIKALRRSFRKVKDRHHFHLDAIVVLPDHIHMIMTLPPNDSNYSKRVMLFKTHFTRQIPRVESISPSRASKGERGIWQRRFWEHLIRDEEDYINHINYIHYNPVKHGYVDRPVDWQYSSIHKYIKDGVLQTSWGSTAPIISGQFGESE